MKFVLRGFEWISFRLSIEVTGLEEGTFSINIALAVCWFPAAGRLSILARASVRL